jgi:hypothetical protein
MKILFFRSESLNLGKSYFLFGEKDESEYPENGHVNPPGRLLCPLGGTF